MAMQWHCNPNPNPNPTERLGQGPITDEALEAALRDEVLNSQFDLTKYTLIRPK